MADERNDNEREREIPAEREMWEREIARAEVHGEWIGKFLDDILAGRRNRPTLPLLGEQFAKHVNEECADCMAVGGDDAEPDDLCRIGQGLFAAWSAYVAAFRRARDARKGQS